MPLSKQERIDIVARQNEKAIKAWCRNTIDYANELQSCDHAYMGLIDQAKRAHQAILNSLKSYDLVDVSHQIAQTNYLHVLGPLEFIKEAYKPGFRTVPTDPFPTWLHTNATEIDALIKEVQAEISG